MHKLAGWGWRRIRRKIIELYNVDPGKANLINWLYRGKKPKFKPRTFEKALFYHEAYQLALKLKKEHPGWGHKRIAAVLERKLPIQVPSTTIYYWITGRSRPNVTPLKLSREALPAVAYCIGVGCGDYRRTDGGLRVKDREFIEYFARMYEIATGVKVRFVWNENEGFWETYESGGWLRSAIRTGLWKVFAELDPVNWLKGLFDSEGWPSPIMDHKRRELKAPMIGLALGDQELKDFAKRKLEELDFKVMEEYRGEKEEIIRGMKARFGECWRLRLRGWNSAKRFARIIGFRVSYRREILEDLLRLEPLSPKDRYRMWTLWYRKVDNKWRKINE